MHKRAEIVQEMHRAGVCFEPTLELFEDAIAERLYSAWVERDKPRSVQISWRADRPNIKMEGRKMAKSKKKGTKKPLIVELPLEDDDLLEEEETEEEPGVIELPIEEEGLEDLPELALQDLLGAYTQVLEEAGKEPPLPVSFNALYQKELKEKYPNPEDFGDALARLFDSSPHNLKGWDCKVDVKGDIFKSINFIPLKPLEPLKTPPGGASTRATVEQEEKPLPLLLAEIHKEYNESLQRMREADRHFYRLEEERARNKARWEAGKGVFQIEEGFRKALSNGKLDKAELERQVEALSALRMELGYLNK